MKRIVTIWNTYGPYHVARVRALQRAFADADVVCFSHCTNSSSYEFFNLQPPQHRILVEKTSSQLLFVESLIATIRALWTERPDLVLTCGYERPETLAGVLWARIAGRTVFLMLDNRYDDCQRNRFVEFVKGAYVRLFDGFSYGGDPHKDYLRRLGVPLEREAYGYNCVDNEAVWQGVVAARKTGQPLFDGSGYFLCVARMIAKKNLVRLVHAYAAYVKEIGENGSPWPLVICGDGPERLRVEDAISEHGVVGRVALVGRVDDFDRIVNYYAFARALVLASHENEQWGLVVNEAMASGLPVLVSKQCGCAASLVTDGENGFVFDGESVEQLTAKLRWMHENAHELPRMGERSREIIQDFSPENFARNILSLYSSCRSRYS